MDTDDKLAILAFAIGTALEVYMLWAMMLPESTKEEIRRRARSAASPVTDRRRRRRVVRHLQFDCYQAEASLDAYNGHRDPGRLARDLGVAPGGVGLAVRTGETA